MKLHAVKLGVALGIVWAAVCFIMSFTAMWWGWCDAMVELMASIYIGYSATVLGAFIGLVWAFADAFIGGFVIAWLYNKLVG